MKWNPSLEIASKSCFFVASNGNRSSLLWCKVFQAFAWFVGLSPKSQMVRVYQQKSTTHNERRIEWSNPLKATCLRSKLYSIKYERGIKESEKGVQKCVKKTLHQDLLDDVLSSRGRTWPKFNLNSINCSWLKSTKLLWVLLTTSASSWRMEFSLSLMIIIPSSKQVLFVMFFLVPLNFHFNIIDSYLLILFRWPTRTQWVDKNHGSSCGWWWTWNSHHNFIMNITESWAGRKCLCSLLLITFIYCTPLSTFHFA